MDLILGIQGSLLPEGSVPYLAIFFQLSYYIKFFLACLAIYFIQKFQLTYLFIIILAILGSKAIFGFENIAQPGFYITHLVFYFYIICGYMLGSSLAQHKIEFPLISGNFISLVVIFSAILIILFFSLYSIGLAPRLSLGFQLFILLPILFAYNASNYSLITIFILTLLTGKRGVLILFLVLLGLNKKFTLSLRSMIFLIPITLLSMSFLAYQIGILQRFEPILILFQEMDLSDFDGLIGLLYFATGGRSDEIISYLTSGISFNDILFGRNPGSFFLLFDSGNLRYVPHHFFHVSPLNYIFHFGFFLGSFIILIQFKVFIWSIRAFRESKNLMIGFYQALFIASFLGAIVVVDILFWISFFYSYSLMKQPNIFS